MDDTAAPRLFAHHGRLVVAARPTVEIADLVLGAFELDHRSPSPGSAAGGVGTNVSAAMSAATMIDLVMMPPL
jgi:hypothetical protein